MLISNELQNNKESLKEIKTTTHPSTRAIRETGIKVSRFTKT